MVTDPDESEQDGHGVFGEGNIVDLAMETRFTSDTLVAIGKLIGEVD